MERRGFLKALTTLIIANAIPDSVTKGVEFVEKKIPAPVIDHRYVNHITIVRRQVTITGSAKSEVFWYTFEDGVIEGFYPEGYHMKELQNQMLEERKQWMNQ